MKFSVGRDALLKPLQLVAGVVERRQTLPVLSNVLFEVRGNQLRLTGTDLEVEMVAAITLGDAAQDGEITIPGRKLLDIVKSLPAGSDIKVERDGARAVLKCGRSRYTLATLPASEFPNIEQGVGNQAIAIDVDMLKKLIDSTAFSMAQQDVRYYLNGMLVEVTSDRLRTVATDGHRLAMADAQVGTGVGSKVQVIVPRKGILELSRLLTEGGDTQVKLSLGSNHIRAEYGSLTFTSKLIDGKFPDYERVLPKNSDKAVLAQREELRSALSRAAILSNEKYRGIRLALASGTLGIVANNPEQEEAHEEIGVDYKGNELEIGFNVSYLLDVLNTLKGGQVKLALGDANSSALVSDAENASAWYVVMPMRL
ncbi:MAG: DNA polymerase III subunit beta [Pseudomonadota bacterium]